MKLDRLKKGNSKLHNIWIFDLPAVKSCLNCKSCKSTCYAIKAQRQYPNVMIWRDTNLNLAKYKKHDLIDLLCNQLNKISKKSDQTVRIHSSGDYFSQDYIDVWRFIISKYPDIKFYSYTKVNEILDFTEICKLDNFNLITSLIDNNLNYGDLDYINKISDTYGSYKCPATLNKGIKCNLHCNYCINNNNVVFKIH